MIICELYEKISGDFITRNSQSMFERAGKQTRRWLQDGVQANCESCELLVVASC